MYEQSNYNNDVTLHKNIGSHKKYSLFFASWKSRWNFTTGAMLAHNLTGNSADTKHQSHGRLESFEKSRLRKKARCLGATWITKRKFCWPNLPFGKCCWNTTKVNLFWSETIQTIKNGWNMRISNVSYHSHWLVTLHNRLQSLCSSANKVILSVWWDWKGIVHYELLQSSEAINSTLNCAQLVRLNEAM